MAGVGINLRRFPGRLRLNSGLKLINPDPLAEIEMADEVALVTEVVVSVIEEVVDGVEVASVIEEVVDEAEVASVIEEVADEVGAASVIEEVVVTSVTKQVEEASVIEEAEVISPVETRQGMIIANEILETKYPVTNKPAPPQKSKPDENEIHNLTTFLPGN